jgi:Concanavalin A-like lectin/glucanases superfamily
MTHTRRLGVWTTMVTALLLVGVPRATAASTVALWHMDESSGGMADSSGSGNDGTLQNITRVAPGYGGSGRAYSFNGTNARVVVKNSPSLNPGTQGITVTVHVKTGVQPPPSVGDYDLVRKGSGIYKMEIMGSGQGYCKFAGSGGSASIKAGPNVTDGQWHTISCRKTSSRITLTVDGNSWSKSANVGSISSGATLVLSGKPNGSGDRYKGVMDEVSIAIG